MAAAVITALLDIGTRLPPARRAGWSDAVGVRMGGLRRRTVLVAPETSASAGPAMTARTTTAGTRRARNRRAVFVRVLCIGILPSI